MATPNVVRCWFTIVKDVDCRIFETYRCNFVCLRSKLYVNESMEMSEIRRTDLISKMDSNRARKQTVELVRVGLYLSSKRSDTYIFERSYTPKG